MTKLRLLLVLTLALSINTLSFAAGNPPKPSDSLKKKWFEAYYESIKLNEDGKSESKKLKKIAASMCSEIKKIVEEPYESNLPDLEQDLCNEVLEKNKLTCSEEPDKLKARNHLKAALIKECYEQSPSITKNDTSEISQDPHRLQLAKKCGNKIIIKARFQSVAKLGASTIRAKYIAADPICEPPGKSWYDFMTDYFDVTSYPNPKRKQCGSFTITFVSKKKGRAADGWDAETAVWRLSSKSEVPSDFWEKNQIVDDCDGW